MLFRSFTNAEQAQIAILCPFPYFRGVEEIVDDISSVQALFEFPFSINGDDPIPFSEYDAARQGQVINNSEGDCGMEIEIALTGDPNDIVTDITITNEMTGEWLSLDGTKFVDGGFVAPQKIYINTLQGHKRIQVLDNGVLVNAFATLRKGSTFLQLRSGSNTITYKLNDGASNEFAEVLIKHYDTYRGV